MRLIKWLKLHALSADSLLPTTTTCVKWHMRWKSIAQTFMCMSQVSKHLLNEIKCKRWKKRVFYPPRKELGSEQLETGWRVFYNFFKNSNKNQFLQMSSVHWCVTISRLDKLTESFKNKWLELQQNCSWQMQSEILHKFRQSCTIWLHSRACTN